jgi:hypothetical protein
VILSGVDEKEAGPELLASRPEHGLSGPFFEIGPKNLLRRAELEGLARAAGAAGFDYGVSVILTVPTALIAPIHDLHSGVLPFAQAMAPDPRPLDGTSHRGNARRCRSRGRHA